MKLAICPSLLRLGVSAATDPPRIRHLRARREESYTGSAVAMSSHRTHVINRPVRAMILSFFARPRSSVSLPCRRTIASASAHTTTTSAARMSSRKPRSARQSQGKGRTLPPCLAALVRWRNHFNAKLRTSLVCVRVQRAGNKESERIAGSG